MLVFRRESVHAKHCRISLCITAFVYNKHPVCIKEERQSRGRPPRGSASQLEQENNGLGNGNMYVDTVNSFNVMFSNVDMLTFEKSKSFELELRVWT